MSEHYAGDSPWYIEAIAERTSQTEYSRQWTKTVTIGAVSGNRYHFEGHSETGSALHISDGKTAWELHPEEHAYMQGPAPAKGYQQPKIWEMNEWNAQNAVRLRKELADLSEHYESATRLPDEVIFAGGIEIPCYVIKVDTAQRKGPKTEGLSTRETLWIDKTAWTVRKRVAHDDTFISVGPARVPMTQDTVTNYEIAVLNPSIPDALFHFDPPADTKLVSKFSDRTFGADLPVKPHPMYSSSTQTASASHFRPIAVSLSFWTCGRPGAHHA